MLETKVTLRILSKVRALSELNRVLGPLSRGFSIGDPMGHEGRSRERTFCAWESGLPYAAALESHLREVLTFIDSIGGLEDIRKDCEVDVFCMLSTTNGRGGTLLPHQLMTKMAALELDIVIDVYGDSEDY